MTSPNLPLKGLRVLDFSRVLAGPWCTMLLADAGASVIKVERPGVGDDTRNWGPPFVGISSRRQLSTYFLSVNRGKRSIAVNMKEKAGLDICRTLATEWADVLVENYHRGAMESFDMGYNDLIRHNPGLVYCSISGYGPDGPLAQHPGYDVIASGMYGLMSITGDEHGRPAKVGVASTDVLTGTLAQSGILSALFARQHTGYGHKVDVSLMESQLAGLVNIASSSLNAPEGTSPPKRWGTAHESIVPYQAFPCKSDDASETQYIMVGAGNDAQFQKLCAILKIPEIAQDERFQSNALRVGHRQSLIQALEAIFMTKTRDEWVELLSGKGFPTGPLRTVPEAFACPQAKSRNMVQEMEHSEIGATIRLPRTPISFGFGASDCNGNSNDEVILPPPMLGEHTTEVLSDLLRMDDKAIQELQLDGVIECWDDEEE